MNKTQIRNLIGYLLYLSQLWRIYRWFYQRGAGAYDTIIINYHKIDRKQFENHIRILRKHYRIAPLHELIEHHRNGSSFTSPTVIITFDDGNLCCYTDVFPVVARYEIPISIFLTTGFLDTKNLLWFDAVEHAIMYTSEPSVSLGDDTYPLSTDKDRAYAARWVIEDLKDLDEQTKLKTVEELIHDLNVSPDTPGHTHYECMSWEQVKEMSEAGVDFGGHTVTHPILTHVSPEAADREIADSKNDIETRLDKTIHHFAYPNGEPEDFNDHTIQSLRTHGYACGLSTIHGRCRSGDSLFSLKRVIIMEYIGAGMLIAMISGLWGRLTGIIGGSKSW